MLKIYIKRSIGVIKVEPEYFQKLIISFCQVHFTVLGNVFHFIFAADK
jgi:hypothetical protein